MLHGGSCAKLYILLKLQNFVMGTSLALRSVTDPVTNMFSAGMISVHGTTSSSTAANFADISMLQLRTEHTKAGADAGGSTGLLSFRMDVGCRPTLAATKGGRVAVGNC